MSFNWYLRPRLPDELGDALYPGVSDLLRDILYWRGVQTHVAAFLERTLPLPVDPFAMKGMRPAVDRIWRAINRREPILIYGDYDADGVSSTALLFRYLRRLGATVYAHIPNRSEEGYGLSSEPLDQYWRSGVKLIVTVDNGIAAIAAVAAARQIGFDVIVTDHHPPGSDLPPANVIVNPKQPGCAYPEKMLAGVGVVYRVCQALSGGDIAKLAALEADLPLVATGSISDVVPMNSLENRALVSQGLQTWSGGPLGLRALLKNSRVSAMDIGFKVGPKLNAAGRLEQARLAFELLISDDPSEAERLADKLDDLNEERKRLTRLGEQQLHQLMVDRQADPVLVVTVGTDIPPGIVGLLAGRLKDMSGKPSLVLHDDGGPTLHGSGRGTPGFDFHDFFHALGDQVQGGGHKGAAGVVLERTKLDQVRVQLANSFSHLSGAPDIPLLIDLEVGLAEASRLWNLLPKLEPFGEQYGSPLLVTRGLILESVRELKNDTLRFTFVDPLANRDQPYLLEGTFFRASGLHVPHTGSTVDIVYTMEQPWKYQGFPYLPWTAMLVDVAQDDRDYIPCQPADTAAVNAHYARLCGQAHA